MLILWGSLAGLSLYLELVYHFSSFGFCGINPLYAIGLIAAWAGVKTMLVGILKGRWKKIIFYVFIWFSIFWAALQLVYFSIFKQPLLWEAIFTGGQDALTNYWREALMGILKALPFLILLILPGIAAGILLHKKIWKLPEFKGIQLLRTAVIAVAGFAFSFVVMQVGKAVDADYYEEYTEFYDPLSIAQDMGVLPMLQRDTAMSIAGIFDGLFDGDDKSGDEFSWENYLGDVTEEWQPDESTDDDLMADGETQETQEPEATQSPEPAKPVILPHAFDLDYDALFSLADNKKQKWLAEYIAGQKPTTTNEYTGIFEGYNLIFLTAEGFSPYAVREDLTPTLYRLIHSGFVFENYYVPLWQTSTSDGEYINCTGLIPDGQFSMRKSGSNNMAFGLAKFFANEGVSPLAYHNNSLSYYDRHVTHPNLGYDFKAAKLGKLEEAEWGGQLFPMENPNRWPASDLDMMQGSIPQFIDQERFHVYYMTISGHMNYNFGGNAMSRKNKEAVQGLEMSENAQAYIACHIELDKALEYLLAELEAAGKLENTVICMSADHYPYAMTEEEYEELAGKDLSDGMDKFRNNLILWNAGMEEEPVTVTKACGSMDLLPTLLNLFGFEYDSRMYAGRDIFSDVEGMVIFNDRSFVTDSCIYNKKAKQTKWLAGEDGSLRVPENMQDAYFDAMKQEVKDRYQFSAYILQENYYQDIINVRK